jgi:tetratricopeptide (TPR) repeat protein
MKKILLACLLAFGLPLAAEQDSLLLPRLSPHASVSQIVGTTTVTVEFNRPAVKGRRIWGDLVPYGEVWRAGANEATTIRFSDAVKVNGSPVPAGIYALFIIPGPEQWTFILSKRWRQFGAFEYQGKDDVLRFHTKPRAQSSSTEWLTYEITPTSRSSAYVELLWERLRVSFLVEVNVDEMVASRIRQAIARAGARDWKTYADAALYYLEQNTELDQAMTWTEKSIRIQENPTNLFLKGRLQWELGRPPQAMATLEQALKLARSQKAPATVTGPIQQTLDHWMQIQTLNGPGN